MSATTSSALSGFQSHFMQALISGPGAGPDWASQPGFAVYRNTVMKACLDALEANFPAVARLVGSDWFRSAAALHVVDHLPNDPRLMNYGARFPHFLAQFEPAADWPYLASVARLDRCWTESHLAADAAPVASTWLAQLPPQELAGVCLRPHPATRWAWFPELPVYSIWAANRSDPAAQAAAADWAWQGEGALLTRQIGTATGWPADRGTCAFLDACAAGAILAEAAEAAQQAQADVNVSKLLAALLQRGALQL